MSNISCAGEAMDRKFQQICALVDEQTGLFKKEFAHQLFYERPEESLYPSDFPNDFNKFYNTYFSLDIQSALNACCIYLNFVGISIDHKKAHEHVRNNPAAYQKFVDKCYYILKSLAHTQAAKLVDPFKDTFPRN